MATVLLYCGFALFIAYITKIPGLAISDDMAMVNIPGKGKRYHKMPPWIAGIIFSTLFVGLGFGIIYYVMFFMDIN